MQANEAIKKKDGKTEKQSSSIGSHMKKTEEDLKIAQEQMEQF